MDIIERPDGFDIPGEFHDGDVVARLPSVPLSTGPFEHFVFIGDDDPGPVYIENAILSGEAIRVDGGYLLHRMTPDPED